MWFFFLIKIFGFLLNLNFGLVMLLWDGFELELVELILFILIENEWFWGNLKNLEFWLVWILLEYYCWFLDWYWVFWMVLILVFFIILFWFWKELLKLFWFCEMFLKLFWFWFVLLILFWFWILFFICFCFCIVLYCRCICVIWWGLRCGKICIRCFCFIISGIK